MSLNARLRKTWTAIRPRMLPKLVIVGAQKAGTTTVFDMLSRHPKVLPPVRKELHFFDVEERYNKGMRYYRSLFPVIPAKSKGYITLEASPRYLFFSDTCAPRIAKHLPKTSCLILLRDPVKRAYSAWNMNRTVRRRPYSLGVPEHRSFAQAVEDEMAGRTREEQHMYLARSSYARQVADYKKHIHPDRLLVHSFERLKIDAPGLINELCDHLGIHRLDPGSSLFHLRSNRRPYPESMDPGLQRELYTYFEPEMQKLAAVLGYMPNIISR